MCWPAEVRGRPHRRNGTQHSAVHDITTFLLEGGGGIMLVTNFNSTDQTDSHRASQSKHLKNNTAPVRVGDFQPPRLGRREGGG